MRKYNDIPFWKEITQSQWSDWHWQMRNSITSLSDLKQILNISDDQLDGIEQVSKHLKLKISPHIMTLLDPDNLDDPLRLQFLPTTRELENINEPYLFLDVNEDEKYSPVKGLVHRYPSKVLLLTSNYCGAYCRYCFRRKLNRDIEHSLTPKDISLIVDYLNSHSEIEEVIFSGGDPLVLEDALLLRIIEQIAKVPHIQILRLHTRMPIVVPFRITDRLLNLMKRFKKRFPIYFVIHVSSNLEFSPEFTDAVERIIDSGFPCLSSSPLLRGINDNEETLRNMWTELVRLRVKPYYLFQSDPVAGLKHFMVPIESGLELIRNLYDKMSGLGMPLYCFNIPEGGGHILLSPSYLKRNGLHSYEITNFEGKTFTYIEPET